MNNLERIIKREDLVMNRYYYYSVKGNSQFFEGKYTVNIYTNSHNYQYLSNPSIDGNPISGKKYKKLYTFYTKHLGKTKETILSKLNLRSIDSSCLENGKKYYYLSNIDDYDENNNVIINEGIIIINICQYDEINHCIGNKRILFLYNEYVGINTHCYTTKNAVSINPSNVIFYTNYTKNEMEKELEKRLKKREVFYSLPPL